MKAFLLSTGTVRNIKGDYRHSWALEQVHPHSLELFEALKKTGKLFQNLKADVAERLKQLLLEMIKCYINLALLNPRITVQSVVICKET